MKFLLIIPLSLAAVAAGFLLLQLTSGAESEAVGQSRAVSALGVANVAGEETFVHVTVAVPSGRDARQVAEAALEAQGARPIDSAGLQAEGFTTTGLVWDSLPVVQNYNASGEPTGVDGLTALTNTHAMWDAVPTSSFDIDFGSTTGRCPSLVLECPGPQRFDNKNGVAWLALGGCCTLGVTWFGTTTSEADMALNTLFAWNDGCVDVVGSFDAQTVMGHENGHVGGLGHSGDTNALMFDTYNDAQCALAQDDMDGISSIYPTGGATPGPTATPTETPPPTTTPTPSGEATPTPTVKCPPGWQRRGIC